MPWTLGRWIFLALVLHTGSAGAQSAPEWKFCDNREFGTLDERIRDCTALIQSSQQTQQSRAAAHNNRGVAYYRKGNLDSALADFNEAIRLNPKAAAPYYNRGSLNTETGHKDYHRALADYEVAIKLDPRYARAYSGRGDIYFDWKDYDRALADYEAAIKLDPKWASAYNGRGEVYRSKGDYERAIADYNEALRLDPRFTAAYRNRENARKEQARLPPKDGMTDDWERCEKTSGDIAIGACQRAIASGRYSGDNLATLRNKSALAFEAQGDHDRAIVEFGDAIRINPKFAVAYYNRGLSYLATGDYNGAIADHAEAMRLERDNGAAVPDRGADAKYSVAYSTRGVIFSKKRDYEHAIADYTEALRLDPANAYAYNRRGAAYQAKNDYERAIADYSEAIRLDGNDANYLNDRCRARAAINRDLTLALADCTEAMHLRLGFAEAMESRGFVNLRLSQVDDAAADFEAALQLEPDRATAMYGRGLAKRNKGDAAGGNADLAAARKIEMDIDKRLSDFAK